MATTTQLTEAAVKKLVDDWYSPSTSTHRSRRSFPLVASNGLEMYWPEGPTFGVDEFKGWYDRVTQTFFDEVHTMKELAITPARRRGGREARRQLAGARSGTRRTRRASGSAWMPARHGWFAVPMTGEPSSRSTSSTEST